MSFRKSNVTSDLFGLHFACRVCAVQIVLDVTKAVEQNNLYTHSIHAQSRIVTSQISLMQHI